MRSERVMRMKTCMPVAGWIALVACCGGVRADDVAVEGKPPAANQPRVQVVGGDVGTDLGQIFDAQVFGGGMHPMVMGGEVEQPDQSQPAEGTLGRLAAVRRCAEARIATVDRIVGLSGKQRKKLDVAMQSDLRRLAETIDEVRSRYLGQKVKPDPQTGGYDAAGQQKFTQVHEDAARCRQLLQAATGPDSLLAKVLPGTLDDAQAATYTEVMGGRRACRWKAIVAAGLAGLDDTLGLTQKQHDEVESLLMADVPPLMDDLQAAAGQPLAIPPTITFVAARLADLGDGKLLMLDERQRGAIAQYRGMGLEANLVQQGVLEAKP